MEKVIAGLLVTFGVGVLAFALGVVFAFPVMWAWNHTIPSVFGLREISFIDAWCLNFLAGMFFKSQTASQS